MNMLSRPRHTLVMLAGLVAALGSTHSLVAQATTSDSSKASPSPTAAQSPPATRWYERMSIRGYAQFRYSRLLETNRKVTATADRSVGDRKGFFIRRGRLTLSGDLNSRVSFVIQPDYAVDAAGSQNYFQLRDAFFDFTVDAKKELRIRVGQTVIPFGFETIVSSSQPVAFEYTDAINSGMPGERDLGALVMWAPAAIRARFRMLTDSGLKGGSDFGVIAAGVYNGQTLNRPELNNSLHGVVHVAYPFRLANGQIIEVGAHAFDGNFVLPASQLSTGVTALPEYDDRRAAVSLVIYPQPLGITAEWNAGTGPEFDPALQKVTQQKLKGGYVQAMYRLRARRQQFMPYFRAQYYDGGRKVDQDARSFTIREYETGVEWQPMRNFELTGAYSINDRRSEDRATIGNRQKGNYLRMQAQISY